MTYETYENLKRVNARRKRSATYAGNWKEVSRCTEEDQRLDAQYGRAISPEQAGHPDNPVFCEQPDHRQPELMKTHYSKRDAERTAGRRFGESLVGPPVCENCGKAATHLGCHPDEGRVYVCARCTVGQGFSRLKRLEGK